MLSFLGQLASLCTLGASHPLIPECWLLGVLLCLQGFIKAHHSDALLVSDDPGALLDKMRAFTGEASHSQIRDWHWMRLSS